MDALAGGAEARAQPPLESRLAVLLGELDVPLAARVACGERLERSADRGEILRRQQLLEVQHLGMGDRGAHIVGHQPLIERVILAGGVLEHALIERCALVPQARHGLLCCSAGLSALISATISVPVPSLVNTSARIPSGER